jgi:hypothetical protein
MTLVFLTTQVYMYCIVKYLTLFTKQLRIRQYVFLFTPVSYKFKVYKSVHHRTIQINQPTRCNNAFGRGRADKKWII